MQPFLSILRERAEDASINTIERLVKTKNVGGISAERSNLSAEENTARTAQLRSDLIARKIDHIPVNGRYTENFGTPNAKTVDGEKSFFVHSHKDILPHLKELGTKYGQDSILHKYQHEETAKLHGTNDAEYPGKDKTDDVGHFKPKFKGEFHSVLKNGDAFSFAA